MAAGNVSGQEVWAFSGKSKDSFRFRDHQGSRIGTSCDGQVSQNGQIEGDGWGWVLVKLEGMHKVSSLVETPLIWKAF